MRLRYQVNVLRILAIAFSVAIVFWIMLARLFSSDTALREARQNLEALCADVRKVAASGPVTVNAVDPAKEDLVGRVQQALSAAGLPVATVIGIQPREDVELSAAGVRWRRMQISFANLTPFELGGWLQAWSAIGKPWTVEEIQLDRGTGERDVGVDNNRFSITIMVGSPVTGKSRP